MGVLDQILTKKRAELPELRTRKWPAPPSWVPVVDLKRRAEDGLHLICEIKHKSPSAGELSTQLSVKERAQVYENGGADMISVLCDTPFFGGAYDHLLEARSGCALPLLCKEFVIDECQLDAAQSCGASAVLLIVRCLDDPNLERLIQGAAQRSLVPLVEVFTEQEAQRALEAGATFIGVNARDLDTLHMDVSRASRIISGMAPHITVAHLSGIKSQSSLAEVRKGRADAALIGEVLMKLDDPAKTLRDLAQAAKSSSFR